MAEEQATRQFGDNWYDRSPELTDTPPARKRSEFDEEQERKASRLYPDKPTPRPRAEPVPVLPPERVVQAFREWKYAASPDLRSGMDDVRAWLEKYLPRVEKLSGAALDVHIAAILSQGIEAFDAVALRIVRAGQVAEAAADRTAQREAEQAQAEEREEAEA